LRGGRNRQGIGDSPRSQFPRPGNGLGGSLMGRGFPQKKKNRVARPPAAGVGGSGGKAIESRRVDRSRGGSHFPEKGPGRPHGENFHPYPYVPFWPPYKLALNYTGVPRAAQFSTPIHGRAEWAPARKRGLLENSFSWGHSPSHQGGATGEACPARIWAGGKILKEWRGDGWAAKELAASRVGGGGGGGCSVFKLQISGTRVGRIAHRGRRGGGNAEA